MVSSYSVSSFPEMPGKSWLGVPVVSSRSGILPIRATKSPLQAIPDRSVAWRSCPMVEHSFPRLARYECETWSRDRKSLVSSLGQLLSTVVPYRKTENDWQLGRRMG